MSRFINPFPRFTDDSGNILSSGKLVFKDTGTDDLKQTYSNKALTVANPLAGVTLSGGGSAPDIFYTGEAKVEVLNSDDELIDSADPVTGFGSGEAEWVNTQTATFSSATQFTVSGDQTAEYHAGRRVKLTDASTLYGDISASTFLGAVTQVTVTLDSGSITASLTQSETGILSADSRSAPKIPTTEISSVTSTAEEVNLLDITAIAEFKDDFFGDTVNGDFWNLYSGTDAQATNPTINTNLIDGIASLQYGDDAAGDMAANGSELVGARQWRINEGTLRFEAAIYVPFPTDICVYAGFTDNSASLEMPFTLGPSDVLTSNATDAVGFLYDTAATTDNIWCVGVANNVDASKKNSGLDFSTTTRVLRIEIDSSANANFYIDGSKVNTTVMQDAVSSSINLAPCIAVFSRTTATSIIACDYVRVYKTRSAVINP